MRIRSIYLLFFFLILVVVFFLLYSILQYYGKKHDQGLERLLVRPSDPPATQNVRSIRRITVIQENDDSCLDILPNGVVQRYETCGGEMKDAYRAPDPKYILRLMQLASQIDLAEHQRYPSGRYLTIVVETDEGTHTLYIPIEEENNDIATLIRQIQEDIPQHTPMPTVFTNTPTPTQGMSITSTPTVSLSITPGSSPTVRPTPSDIVDNPFTCGYFEETGRQRPYNVSNFICTTEPSPAP